MKVKLRIRIHLNENCISFLLSNIKVIWECVIIIIGVKICCWWFFGGKITYIFLEPLYKHRNEEYGQKQNYPRADAGAHHTWCCWCIDGSYLIFVIFSPRALFLAKFFSAQKHANRKKMILRQSSVNRSRKTNFPTKQCKMQQNTINCTHNEGDFRFLYIFHVKKFEINPNVEKF